MKLLMKKRASKPNPRQETRTARESEESHVSPEHSRHSAESEPAPCSDFREYPGTTIRLRPGTVKSRWEGKITMPDGRVVKAVLNFVKHLNEVDESDEPRRAATWYPLDPPLPKKKRRSS